MIEQIYTYFTMEMIYFWLNLGVLPFWLILIFFPQAKICKIFTISIFPIFALSLIYCYLIYHIFQYGYDFSINFRFSGSIFTVKVLFVGFPILNKADVVSPGLNLPPNQLV